MPPKPPEPPDPNDNLPGQLPYIVKPDAEGNLPTHIPVSVMAYHAFRGHSVQSAMWVDKKHLYTVVQPHQGQPLRRYYWSKMIAFGWHMDESLPL